MSTVQGRSLHIGVNEVNPDDYDGKFKGELKGCENDAMFMESVAKFHGFTPKHLLGRRATCGAVLGEIEAVAQDLEEGSFFLLTFAGHGSRLPNKDPYEIEAFDQTWCLFDGQVRDDELYVRWPLFEKGVRVLVISDSCYSGTILSAIFLNEDERALPPYQVRSLPLEVAIASYERNHDKYDIIRGGIRRPLTRDINASILSISACQDDEPAADGLPHGRFTAAIKREWNEGRTQATHELLWFRVHNAVSHTDPNQHPKWDYAGMLNHDFWHGKAFKL